MRRANRYSIFAQGLDRALFLAYFLGAVVPLAALGFVFVRPALESSFGASSWMDDVGSLARLGVVASSAVLCLVSFWIMRRFATTALARMTLARANALQGLVGVGRDSVQVFERMIDIASLREQGFPG